MKMTIEEYNKKKEEILKAMKSVENDIEICERFHDYEDIGFYNYQMYNLENELQELEDQMKGE